MKIEKTLISGCYVIHAEPLEDERGWFARTFCEKELFPYTGELKFVQINHSYNKRAGTFRGMHYQAFPFVDSKLIRCINGSAIDIIADLRAGSPTFLKYITIEISRENRNMVFLPKGTVHGFQTLADDTELIYHHTVSYHPELDCGIRYNDPLLDIKLPNSISIISVKDQTYKLLDKEFKGIEL